MPLFPFSLLSFSPSWPPSLLRFLRETKTKSTKRQDQANACYKTLHPTLLQNVVSWADPCEVSSWLKAGLGPKSKEILKPFPPNTYAQVSLDLTTVTGQKESTGRTSRLAKKQHIQENMLFLT